MPKDSDAVQTLRVRACLRYKYPNDHRHPHVDRLPASPHDWWVNNGFLLSLAAAVVLPSFAAVVETADIVR